MDLRTGIPRSLALPIHHGLPYLRLERRHTLPPERRRVFLCLIPLLTPR